MFLWSDKQQPVLVALETYKLISCCSHRGTFCSVSLSAGVCWWLNKAAKLLLRKFRVLGMLQLLVSFRSVLYMILYYSIKSLDRPGELGHGLKSLLCKHGDLSSIPNTHIKARHNKRVPKSSQSR